MLRVLGNILCDLDPKVKTKGKKAGFCDGVPSTAALVLICFVLFDVFVTAVLLVDVGGGCGWLAGWLAFSLAGWWVGWLLLLLFIRWR